MDFTYEELQGLDAHVKDDYINRILNEDAQISSYIKNVFEKIEDTEDKLVDIEYGIQNTKEDWDSNM